MIVRDDDRVKLGTVSGFALTVPLAFVPLFGRKLLAGLLAAGFFAICGPAAAQDAGLAVQMQRIRRDLSDLQSYVYSGKPPPGVPGKPRAAASQGGEIQTMSRLQVKIQIIESQMRDLTGKFEKVEHQLLVLKDRLDKLAADVDQRFLALESGGGGAAAKRRRPSAAATLKGLRPGQKVLGTLPSKKGGKARTSKSPKAAKRKKALPKGTPKQKYDHARRLLEQGKYANAARAFKAFVRKHPGDPLASNAMYWLGEIHYYRKNYVEAARVFLDGYKQYPKGGKAPDNLYKLGKSLAAINEKKQACKAWRKLAGAYPKADNRLLRNAKGAMKQNGCV